MANRGLTLLLVVMVSVNAYSLWRNHQLQEQVRGLKDSLVLSEERLSNPTPSSTSIAQPTPIVPAPRSAQTTLATLAGKSAEVAALEAKIQSQRGYIDVLVARRRAIGTPDSVPRGLLTLLANQKERITMLELRRANVLARHSLIRADLKLIESKRVLDVKSREERYRLMIEQQQDRLNKTLNQIRAATREDPSRAEALKGQEREIRHQLQLLKQSRDGMKSQSGVELASLAVELQTQDRELAAESLGLQEELTSERASLKDLESRIELARQKDQNTKSSISEMDRSIEEERKRLKDLETELRSRQNP